MMKRIFVIVALIISLSLSACSQSPQSEDQSNAAASESVWDITEVVTFHSDRIHYSNLRQLLGPVDWGADVLEDFSADLVVMGEFIAETDSKLLYEYRDSFAKEVVVGAAAYNQLLITEVLEGDVKPGDVITIAQDYAFDKERSALITFSELTPMHKGDRWIYFLTYSGDGYYHSIAGSDGRYPIPNEALMKLADEVLSGLNAREKWLRGKGQMKEGEKIGEEGWWYVPDREGHYYRITREEAEEFDRFIAPVNELLDTMDTSSFGVLNRYNFNYSLYAEILDHYRIKSQDWVNPGQEYDAIIIDIHEKQIWR